MYQIRDWILEQLTNDKGDRMEETFFSLGAEVTTAEGSVKPIAGFTLD